MGARHVSRRRFLAGAAGLGGLSLHDLSPDGPSAVAETMTGITTRHDIPAIRTSWRQWKSAFLQPDGRVIDTGNGGISHTEGQGTAMLAALRMDDREVFARVWRWTRETLADSDTGLLRWRDDPKADPAKTDPNNATDGDLMIAWALVSAGRRWDIRALSVQGLALAGAIHEQLSRPCTNGLLLLPGRTGFEADGKLTLNPSYALFPAFRALAAADRHHDWSAVIRGHERLVRTAAFGRHGLPPDWLVAPADWDGTHAQLSLPEQPPPRFGYDAIRVPLYLCWGGYGADWLTRFEAYWAVADSGNFIPAWCDLHDGSLSAEAAPAGFHSVRQLAVDTIKQQEFKALPPNRADKYYSASLTLLCQLAAADSGRLANRP